jgi:hypothetical protein
VLTACLWTHRRFSSLAINPADGDRKIVQTSSNLANPKTSKAELRFTNCSDAAAAYFTVDPADNEQKDDKDDSSHCDRQADIGADEAESSLPGNTRTGDGHVEVEDDQLDPPTQLGDTNDDIASEPDDLPALRSSDESEGSTEDSGAPTDDTATSSDDSEETSGCDIELCESGSSESGEDGHHHGDAQLSHAAYFGNEEGDITQTLIVDSGTSAHVISGRSNYSTFERAREGDCLLGVGEAAKIIGRGDVRVIVRDDDGQPTTILLQDCICIAGGVFLLSVKRFALRGATAVFKKTGSALVVKGRSFPMTLSRGLYVMQTVMLRPTDDAPTPSSFTATAGRGEV